MKKTLFIICLILFTYISTYSQFTEEFSLPYQVEMFDLDQSGPKYFCMYRDLYGSSDTLYFYNTDYTLYKKITVIQGMSFNLSDIINISENIFNSDDNIEIMYKSGDSIRIINEEQEILFSAMPRYYYDFYSIEENIFKFKYRYREDDRYKFAVYDAMNIELEHVYDSAHNVALVDFKYSGKKYVVYNKLNNKVGIFNSDHTLFKNIDISFTSYSLMDIYEIDNNGTYSFNLSFYSSSNGIYKSYIYNENGELLSEFNNSQSAVCYDLKTGERKILTSGTPTNSYTTVYNENFELEKKYDYHGVYTDIEYHGEKLCFSDAITNTYYIYNTDNTLYKKIDLDVIYDYGVPSRNLNTTHFFNTDNQIEIIYRDEDYNNIRYVIMNENSEKLHTFNINSGIQLYNFQDTKILITRNYISSFPLNIYTSKIYSVIPLTSSKGINSETTIEIYPNPSNSQLNIRLESGYKGQIQIHIYSIEGVKIHGSKFQKYDQISTESIDLSNLDLGTYFIKIHIGNEIITKKILKL